MDFETALAIARAKQDTERKARLQAQYQREDQLIREQVIRNQRAHRQTLALMNARGSL